MLSTLEANNRNKNIPIRFSVFLILLMFVSFRYLWLLLVFEFYLGFAGLMRWWDLVEGMFGEGNSLIVYFRAPHNAFKTTWTLNRINCVIHKSTWLNSPANSLRMNTRWRSSEQRRESKSKREEKQVARQGEAKSNRGERGECPTYGEENYHPYTTDPFQRKKISSPMEDFKKGMVRLLTLLLYHKIKGFGLYL